MGDNGGKTVSKTNKLEPAHANGTPLVSNKDSQKPRAPVDDDAIYGDGGEGREPKRNESESCRIGERQPHRSIRAGGEILAEKLQ